MKTNEYDRQAARFLAKHGIKFTCKLGRSDKAPGWAKPGEEHGQHYRITLSKGTPGTAEHTGSVRAASRISFDFWGSIADRRAGIETELAYSVLACISGDVNTPETFADFCGDYGYDTDSRTAYSAFKRCDRFAKRLRAFLTEAEIADLSTIN